MQSDQILELAYVAKTTNSLDSDGFLVEMKESGGGWTVHVFRLSYGHD